MAERTASDPSDGWAIAQRAAQLVGTFDRTLARRFAVDEQGGLQPVSPNDASAVLSWDPPRGWVSLLAADDARHHLLELYLPVCSASADAPITIGHLGQSLDGFIATLSGDSNFVTGPQNILHLHRLRALCDAIIVGTETVASDNPRLTTRLVLGPNPLRVILDRECRLSTRHHVFSDGEAPTVRACRTGLQSTEAARERGEDLLEVASQNDELDLQDLLRQLRARGCARIFIEGGGVTVSSFLEAGLLDRLHIAVAALFIGEGRPAIRMSPQSRLKDCLRVQQRVYQTGEDILFDCDLRAVPKDPPEPVAPSQAIRRIL